MSNCKRLILYQNEEYSVRNGRLPFLSLLTLLEMLFPIYYCKERVVRAAENNLPDENTLGITNEIVDHLDTLRQGDLCISLISGFL